MIRFGPFIFLSNVVLPVLITFKVISSSPKDGVLQKSSPGRKVENTGTFPQTVFKMYFLLLNVGDLSNFAPVTRLLFFEEFNDGDFLYTTTAQPCRSYKRSVLRVHLYFLYYPACLINPNSFTGKISFESLGEEVNFLSLKIQMNCILLFIVDHLPTGQNIILVREEKELLSLRSMQNTSPINGLEMEKLTAIALCISSIQILQSTAELKLSLDPFAASKAPSLR